MAKPYDPAQPIDLSGTAGVTAAQQARAENIIAVTLADLPRWADTAVAEADGFRSIGDGITGYEHYINWAYLTDGKVLDPDHPESLVYRHDGTTKQLVSAMFMLEPGSTLDDVPELGGALTQWHIHDDLCFTDDPVQPRVAGDHLRRRHLPGPAEEVRARSDDPRVDRRRTSAGPSPPSKGWGPARSRTARPGSATTPTAPSTASSAPTAVLRP